MFSLKQARVGIDATQKEIAEKMGVHEQTYMNMEKHPGNMTIKQAMLFCDIVGKSFDEIIFLENNSN